MQLKVLLYLRAFTNIRKISLLCVKTTSLAGWGKPNGDNSMLVKGCIFAPSYIIYGEVNEPLFKLTGQWEVCSHLIKDVFYLEFNLYVVGFIQEKSNSQNSYMLLLMRRLSINSRIRKNFGLPERGNSGGIRRLVVPKNSNMWFSKTESAITRLGKGSRFSTFSKDRPKGLNDLNKLILDNVGGRSVIEEKQKVIHIVSNPDVLVLAYSNIKKNNEYIGPDKEILDGINYQDFVKLGRAIGSGVFKFRPSRRISIKKQNGKLRFIGIPSPRDKIVQEAIRMVLEAIWEPTFSEISHGYRPNKSCHTALNKIKITFGHTK